MQLRQVDKTLLFAGGDGRLHVRAVVIEDGIAGILPTLILHTVFGAALVFIEPVTINVGIFLEPAQSL